MGHAWTELTGELAGSCAYLDDSDVCYYARIRKPGGYSKSEANQWIANLKKDASRKGKSDWIWKERAVEKFAKELHCLVNNAIDKQIPICFIPSSKLSNDPLYDPRWDMLEKELLAIDKRYRIEYPVGLRSSTEAFHYSRGSSRHPDGIIKNFVWNGFSQPVSDVIVVDDVLTTGGHFKAMKSFILENVSEKVEVYGVFWAKHQFDDVTADVFDEIA